MVNKCELKTVLTIAGSDSSGGAGIQADLKTMLASGVYGMSAITALTAQNTTGVTAVARTAPDFLAAQLDSVFTDIFPDAIKTGMVFDSELIAVITAKLKAYHAKNIVVDPVMVATSGARLLNEDAISALKEQLLPLATVITPNLMEAEVLAGLEIKSHEDMILAAQKLYETYGCNVLCKGGHRYLDADDLLYKPFIKIDDLSEGLGLGLPLCKRHALSLGGDLIYDRDYHDGCRFILEMPK
jgi:hydroxymethylpyrimidine/phosphomethylpyrimidine kinase/hydroxymethylpyrimidine kinase/phosphomethylpyrimidine kinase/thiamine-phosphate diphosphorylase